MKSRTLEVGLDVPLQLTIEALACTRCDEIVPSSDLDRRIRLEALRCVALSGQANAETFRFLRTGLGLQAKELAYLFQMDAGTISRWENGVRDVELRAWALLACMALDLAGSTDPHPQRRVLEALRSPPSTREGLEVRVSSRPPPPEILQHAAAR